MFVKSFFMMFWEQFTGQAVMNCGFGRWNGKMIELVRYDAL